MTEDTVAADPADRPLMPPEPESGGGALRWVITGIAAVLLVVGAWRAYEWFIADVAQRRAVAAGEAPTLRAPAQAQTPATEAPAVPIPRTVQPPAPAAQPAAPAVGGLEGVNKCVVDGQVTYTNTPCPPGSTLEPRDTATVAVDNGPTGTDANGVLGSTGESGAVQVARPAVFSAEGHDPSQRHSLCGYWTAEIERLDFEFQQPLPPPVLDQISTHLASLRGQFVQARCGALPKSAQAAASAPAKPPERKRTPSPQVVEERSGD